MSIILFTRAAMLGDSVCPIGFNILGPVYSSIPITSDGSESDIMVET